MPFRSIARLRKAAARRSSWRSISLSMTWTSVTRAPPLASPYAASMPSSPPPMTAIRRRFRAASRSAGQIGEVAKGHDAGQRHARHRQAHGGGSRRKNDAIEGDAGSFVGENGDAPGEIEPFDAPSSQQANATFAIPIGTAQRDIRLADIAGKQGGQQHAIVAGLRLGADDGRIETIGHMGHELFAEPHAGHAVADDEKLFDHGCLIRRPVRPRPPCRKPRRS